MEIFVPSVTALLLGALHALEPGHGKTIVASYMLAATGHIRRIFLLGISIALSHTFTIIVIALLIDGAGTLIADERIHSFLEGGSGLLIMAIGMQMLHSSLKAKKHAEDCSCGHDHEEHHHAHHTGRGTEKKETSSSSIAFLGFSAGIIPCPSALAALLSSLAVGKFSAGFMMVVLFSIGIALTLMAVAFGTRYAASAIARYQQNEGWMSGSGIARLSGAMVLLFGTIAFFRFLLHDWGSIIAAG